MFSSVVFSSERFSTQRLLRLALVLSLVGLGASLNSSVLAQAYPSKPVKIIIPFPPGGTLDIVGRMLAQKLGEQTGQPLAIVSGSSSGIGRAVVERLLASGWRVIGLDLAAATIEHPAFTATQLDLAASSQREFARLDSSVLESDPLERFALEHQNADAWVHAAGIMRVASLGQLQADDGRRMFQIHVEAALKMANILLPAMATRGCGRVVLIGSRVAAGIAHRSQYAASKAALTSLARSWAAEVVSRGVTVNVVSPAATDTPLLNDPARTRAASDPSLTSTSASSSLPIAPPMGRLIQPAEVAALVAYLLSIEAAAITGQDIQICGGSSLTR